MMREQLLGSNPDIGEVTMDALVGVANAIEVESARRYEALAQTMRRRGETETAAAFEAMLAEERSHVVMVERWAGGLGKPLPATAEYAWSLPRELAGSWEEVAGSVRLTPYRAFAIAVVNEQRAFALYSYLAAQAEDPAVAAQAERLALEELRHAALMRRWRRLAWHTERRDARPPEPGPQVIAAVADLRALIERHETTIAERHRALAAQLQDLGDRQSATLLDSDAARPDDRLAEEYVGFEPTASVPLLTAALEPLELFSEELESMLLDGEGPLIAMTERAHSDVVRRIARLELQIERRSRS